MQFRLVYRGGLPAQNAGDGRVREKHAIRKVLHPQLKELWKQHAWLGVPDVIGAKFDRCGFRFVPLIQKQSGLGCAIDILFLRRDNPGNLIRSGGDIDNRIKVLFDGLRMPQTCNELSGEKPDAEGQNPFFCLLEDDSQITEIRVITDRLLRPANEVEAEHLHEVELVIHVSCNIDLATVKDLDEVQAYAMQAWMRGIHEKAW